MESWFLMLGWGSPIGIGIFLLCLGGMIYLLSKADAVSKRVRREETPTSIGSIGINSIIEKQELVKNKLFLFLLKKILKIL